MKKLGIAFVLVFTTVIAACSSSSDSGTSGTPATDSGTAPAANTVMVTSNKFVPPALTIKVGETVTWNWAGGAHSVTSGANCTSDNAYGVGVQTSGTFTHTYDKAGTFEYFCIPHCASSMMKGTITVQ